ncbi:NAD-dependent epimerase/dehydratase family protein [Rhizobium sp. RCAM05350]|nr:NAD-dependent epimerase/dehydratase family protein [Rhizobium sp. RCAM05350]
MTGGTGFVAGWCIVKLLERGYAVRTTLRNLSKESAVRAAVASQTGAGDGLSFFAADLTSDDGWDAVMAGCDYVLHVASPLGTGAEKGRDSLTAPARDGTLQGAGRRDKGQRQARGDDIGGRNRPTAALLRQSERRNRLGGSGRSAIRCLQGFEDSG